MESLLNSLLPHWPGVVFVQRTDFSLEFAGGTLAEITGHTAERWERDAHLWWEVLHELDHESFRLQLAGINPTAPEVNQVFRIRHGITGRVKHLSEFRRARFDRAGRIERYEGFWLDVTRGTLAERRLAGASWKETLGLLMLGLAHDLNNALAGFMGLSENFLAQAPPGHPFHEGLVLLNRSTHQAAQIVQRIAQLHRGRLGVQGYHNLNEIIRDNVELLRKILPRRIHVVENLDSNPLPIYADAVELQQVLINLALNAAEAMPEGGTLSLRTSSQSTWPELAHWVGVPPRLPAVCLSVMDTGTGVKARHLPFLFDPFFTTKPMNRGSGLGLYNARLFAEKQQGALSVETAEGAGATFRLWLPQADFTEAEQALQLSRAQRRKLLLAGPPGRLLESTAELLRQHKYHVAVAGEDAEELLRSSDYLFDGALILVELQDPRAAALVRFIRVQKLPVRIILKTAGVDPEELPGELRTKADLIIPADLSEEQILTQLSELFEAAP